MSVFDSITVGQRIPDLVLPPISRTTLALYAGASGDHNPNHIDIDYAREAGMPDVFAHGMLSMAYLGRMLTNWVPQHKIRQFDARFTSITHVGDQITCTGEVEEKVEYHGERLLSLRLKAVNQNGDIKIVGSALVAL